MENHSECKRLGRYLALVSGGALSRFSIARRIPLPDGWEQMAYDEKWQLHETLVDRMFDSDSEKEISSRDIAPHNLMNLKASIASEIVKSCHLCERRCGVNRFNGELGYCKVPSESFYASEFIHVGEEPEIIPSHTIFFAGCTFRCIHCQNGEIIENPTGDYPVNDDLARRIESRFLRGARNVNLVGGNPDQHLHNILKLFADVNVPVPVVWNSNMYHSSESERLLRGFVDLYLADFKYGPGDCAEEISDVENYWSVITRNLTSAREHADIYIRHLLLPGHIECCAQPVMEWVSANLPIAKFNLMFQFRASYKSFGHPDLGRLLSAPEKERALELLEEYGLGG